MQSNMKKKLDYAIFIVRSTSGDIAITVILLNDETNDSVFIDNGKGIIKNRYVAMLLL